MNFKKIVIIFFSIALTITIIALGINYLKNKSEITKLNGALDLGIKYLEEFNVTETNVSKIKELRKQATLLANNNKFSAAISEYIEALNVVTQTLKNESQYNIDASKKYGNSTNELESILDSANNEISKTKYREGFILYKSCIEKGKEILSIYNKEAEKIRPDLEGKVAKEIITGQLNTDYKVISIQLLVNGTWAVATVQPITFRTDNAYMALQYLNGSWRLIAGPGTSFDTKDYPNMPLEVLQTLNGGI